MLRQWVRVRSSLAATTLGGVLVVALVAAAAIVSTGYTAQRLDLSDASVWVASGSRQAVGRVNTEVQELNSVMPDVGADLELVQSGPTVFLMNREDATLGRNCIIGRGAYIGTGVELGDNCKVVGDEELRGAGLTLELLEEGEDLGLHRDVERGRRLVGDEQGG